MVSQQGDSSNIYAEVAGNGHRRHGGPSAPVWVSCLPPSSITAHGGQGACGRAQTGAKAFDVGIAVLKKRLEADPRLLGHRAAREAFADPAGVGATVSVKCIGMKVGEKRDTGRHHPATIKE